MSLAIALLSWAGVAGAEDARWNVAEKQWAAFVQVRQAALGDERRTFTRFRHALIDRKLPGYRFYTDGFQVYALTRRGRVLAHGWRGRWSSQPSWCQSPACVVRDISDMVRSAGITVTTPAEAADVIRLYHLIIGHRHSPVAGADFFGAYKPVAERDGSSKWRVHLQYTGPPEASRFMQPEFVVMTDDANRVLELRQIDSLSGPDGERL